MTATEFNPESRIFRVRRALMGAGFTLNWSQPVRYTGLTVESWWKKTLLDHPATGATARIDYRLVEYDRDDTTVEVYAPLGDKQNGSMTDLLANISKEPK